MPTQLAGQIQLAQVMVNSEPLAGVESAAAELGIDVTECLREVGLHKRVLREDTQISFAAILEFHELVAERFGFDHFGFLVGKHRPVLRIDVFGQLLRLAPNILEAVKLVQEFGILNSLAVGWRLEKYGEYVALVRYDRIAHPPRSAQFRSNTITQVHNIITSLLGGGWRAQAIGLSHARPRSYRVYERFFQAPVLFDQEFDGILMAEADLTRPIVSADPDLLRIVVAHAKTIISQTNAGPDPVSRARLAIQELLLRGVVNKARVAERLGLHPKAMQRQLEEAGTSFNTILKAVRLEQAQRYLKSSDVSLVQLSQFLGYTSAAAFSRAFKKETGVSPDHWRKERC